MRRLFYSSLFLVLMLTCKNKQEFLNSCYVLEEESNAFYENFNRDSVKLFQDTIFKSKLQACNYSIDIKNLKLVSTIIDKRLFLYESQIAFSPTQPEHSFFVGISNGKSLKLYHAIDTNLLNRYLNCQVSISMHIFDEKGKDTSVFMEFEISETGWSPYFYSDIAYKGIQKFEKTYLPDVYCFYPVAEEFDHRDIIKADYDEELGGSPVVGSIDEHRKWEYAPANFPDKILFKQIADEYYTDFEVDSSNSEVEEEMRRTIHSLNDSNDVVYRKRPLGVHTLRK